MTLRVRPLLLALPLLTAIAAPAAAQKVVEYATPPADSELLDRRISFDLDGVPLARLAESLSSLGVSLLLEGGESGELAARPLSLCVDRVRLRVVLDAVCDSVGCRWGRVAGPPGTIALMALPDPSPAAPRSVDERLDERISLSLAGASATDVLRSFSRILSMPVVVPEGMERRVVTLELNETPARDALDAICRQAGCTWRTESSPQAKLVLESRR